MRVALFVTCLTDTFFPRVGEAVVRVLRHFDCQVEFPAGQTCCGQPAFNSGLEQHARPLARRMVELFGPYEAVVTPSASCAAMVRLHFPELLRHDAGLHAAAERLAARTHEFVTFLQRQLGVSLEQHLRFPEPVTFHYPCHAREIQPLPQLARLLESAAGESFRPPRLADLCCGFGGTFSVDLPAVSGRMLDDKLGELEATGCRMVVCNEGGCGLQLAGGAHRCGSRLRFKHLAECLAESLGLMEPQE